MKRVKLSLTVEQARLVEDVISNYMTGLYDSATDEERAKLDETYKSLDTVWRALVKAII
jgi:hypothetical protein